MLIDLQTIIDNYQVIFSAISIISIVISVKVYLGSKFNINIEIENIKHTKNITTLNIFASNNSTTGMSIRKPYLLISKGFVSRIAKIFLDWPGGYRFFEKIDGAGENNIIDLDSRKVASHIFLKPFKTYKFQLFFKPLQKDENLKKGSYLVFKTANMKRKHVKLYDNNWIFD